MFRINFVNRMVCNVTLTGIKYSPYKIQLTFTNNQANRGSVLYGGLLDI